MEALTGIIVKTTRYSDTASIAHLFTEQLGVIAVYISDSSAKKGGGEALITPLNEIEAAVYRKNGSLWQARECRLVYGFLGVRQSLDALQSAAKLVNAVMFSQPEERPSPVLYHLLKDYLRRLERGDEPWKVVGSFLLKTLRFEGVWSDGLPEEEEVVFTEAEWLTCIHLAYCRTGAELKAAESNSPEQLLQKIELLFNLRMDG